MSWNNNPNNKPPQSMYPPVQPNGYGPMRPPVMNGRPLPRPNGPMPRPMPRPGFQPNVRPMPRPMPSTGFNQYAQPRPLPPQPVPNANFSQYGQPMPGNYYNQFSQPMNYGQPQEPNYNPLAGYNDNYSNQPSENITQFEDDSAPLTKAELERERKKEARFKKRPTFNDADTKTVAYEDLDDFSIDETNTKEFDKDEFNTSSTVIQRTKTSNFNKTIDNTKKVKLENDYNKKPEVNKETKLKSEISKLEEHILYNEKSLRRAQVIRKRSIAWFFVGVLLILVFIGAYLAFQWQVKSKVDSTYKFAVKDMLDWIIKPFDNVNILKTKTGEKFLFAPVKYSPYMMFSIWGLIVLMLLIPVINFSRILATNGKTLKWYRKKLKSKKEQLNKILVV